ncbi:MAG: ABC transporter substrate-binding protein [Bradyrhizobium sp.]|uniref:ABC transporter substrate-binding protein n=1 Tax=Bradyrhizobium sp. TaxID=376 RepID=UPI00238850A3|nr:ABC transporter substrate-binding protein [Bradyrhizobium sp.]MDE2600959.1 ABC transporter substrate-binding protein [Bradyrhizobium sp.]
MSKRSRSRRVFDAALLVAIAMLVVPATPLRAAATPKRIVSLNLCTDELVLRLANRANIASISWLARDPISSNAPDLAAGVPVNHGLAEEIIPLDPDLVLAEMYTTRIAVAMLKATHFPVIEFPLVHSIGDVRSGIREMAELVGEPARGEDLVASFDRDLANIGPPLPGPRPTALVFNANGFTVGAGTLVDDVINRAGLDNVAAHMKLGNYAQLPLEVAVRSDVDVLIVGARRDEPPSLATALLDHPVLSKLGPKTHIVVLPTNLWNCGGPEVAEAVARLHAVAAEVVAGRASQ